jgi:DNA-binding MarR family transcriptional regulator
MPSMAITEFQYDEDRNALDVTFVTSKTYRYFSVPRDVYVDFSVAGSKGRFFHRYIRDVYDFVELKEAVAFGRLLTVSLMMADDLERSAAERGLTGSRATVLSEICHRGPVTAHEIAKTLNAAPRSITTLIDALEETGFVKRKKHPADRRATLVHLTTKGRNVASRMKEEAQLLAQEFFGHSSAEELGVFIGALDRVIDRLRHFNRRHQN